MIHFTSKYFKSQYEQWRVFRAALTSDVFFHCIYYKKHWFLILPKRKYILVFKPKSLNLQQINIEREGHSVFKLNKCQQVCPTKISDLTKAVLSVQVKTLFKRVFNNHHPSPFPFQLNSADNDLMMCQKMKKTHSALLPLAYMVIRNKKKTWSSLQQLFSEWRINELNFIYWISNSQWLVFAFREVHNLPYCSRDTEIDAKLGVGITLGSTVTVGLVVWQRLDIISVRIVNLGLKMYWPCYNQKARVHKLLPPTVVARYFASFSGVVLALWTAMCWSLWVGCHSAAFSLWGGGASWNKSRCGWRPNKSRLYGASCWNTWKRVN